MRRLSTEDFVSRSREAHGDRFDYSVSNYVNGSSSIDIICREHGLFSQRAINHMNGFGCSRCSNMASPTNEEFIDFAIKVHGDKYDYSLVKYLKSHSKVIVICYKHGEFKITPTNHRSGRGCPKCSGKHKLSLEEFIEKAQKVHGNKYNYSNFVYVNKNTIGEIVCVDHGSFFQNPRNHINLSHGCPSCRSSKGEDKIAKTLEDSGIRFTPQYTFDDCRDKGKLRFDFAVFNENDDLFGLIEFHGEQHFKSVEFFGGKEAFYGRLKRDAIKRSYCAQNNIKLLEIPYWSFGMINFQITDWYAGESGVSAIP